MTSSKPIKPANAAFAAAVLMFAALCGAWYFQYQLGYAPCPLCYQQRIPYYFAIPLGLALGAFALYGGNRSLIRYGLYLLALILMVSAVMGIYHAGVEWGFWQGPTSCAAGAPSLAPIGNILESLRNVRAVPCNEAAWRLFGISLAGYNALISAFAALIAFAGAQRA
jgi:disulfide bond formation protein DsbB